MSQDPQQKQQFDAAKEYKRAFKLYCLKCWSGIFALICLQTVFWGCIILLASNWIKAIIILAITIILAVFIVKAIEKCNENFSNKYPKPTCSFQEPARSFHGI